MTACTAPGFPSKATGGRAPLSIAYLKALETWLDMYPDAHGRGVAELNSQGTPGRRRQAGRRLRGARTSWSSNVGMAHQALDNVDVHAPAKEVRSVAVTPPVGKVPTAHARRSPGLAHQIVHCPRPVTTTESPVAPGVGEEVLG